MQNYREIPVTPNLEEQFDYPVNNFLYDCWVDDYSELKDNTLNCHWHDSFEFGYVLSGSFDYFINGTHFKLKKGDGFFINARILHMAIADNQEKENQIFGFLFPHTLLTQGSPQLVEKYFQPIIESSIQGFHLQRTTDSHKQLLHSIQSGHRLTPDTPYFELEAINQASKVWKLVVEYVDTQNPMIQAPNRSKEQETKAILSYIYQNYANKFTIDELCKQIGISRSECFRCFKKFTNKKPMEYINEYRLFQASKLLKLSTLSIEEITKKCGFSTSSYFGKQFKELYGVTPLHYRKNNKLKTYF